MLVSLAAYPLLPDQVVSHWNAAGVPDGSMGKLAGTGLVPLIMVALVGLLFLYCGFFLERVEPDWFADPARRSPALRAPPGHHPCRGSGGNFLQHRFSFIRPGMPRGSASGG